MLVDFCMMIDHAIVELWLGTCRLWLDVWLDVPDQHGHHGYAAVTIYFDERGQMVIPEGAWRCDEQSKDGTNWLEFEQRRGSMHALKHTSGI